MHPWANRLNYQQWMYNHNVGYLPDHQRCPADAHGWWQESHTWFSPPWSSHELSAQWVYWGDQGTSGWWLASSSCLIWPLSEHPLHPWSTTSGYPAGQPIAESNSHVLCLFNNVLSKIQLNNRSDSCYEQWSTPGNKIIKNDHPIFKLLLPA